MLLTVFYSCGATGVEALIFMCSVLSQGTQYMLTNWKNNPNERKNVRSNRRG